MVSHKEHNEKKIVALSSILAAVFLTSTKLAVGFFTGSLGILSEALHSGLDLVAAMMTYFAVKIADKPPDDDHHFGHGKVENLSALLQTFLLLATCLWIIYEAYERLTGKSVMITVNVWSYLVVIMSITIDISRSRALRKVAKKYNSQALEADALHFSSDILSSVVVLIGLVASQFNFHIADSISALIVALIVILITFKLGKKSIDALLDKSPDNMLPDIEKIISFIPEVQYVHDLRVRTSGSKIFVDMNIHVSPDMTIQEAHQISEHIEYFIKQKYPSCYIHIHEEPHI